MEKGDIFFEILASLLAKHRLDLADEHAADAKVAQQHGPTWPL